MTVRCTLGAKKKQNIFTSIKRKKAGKNLMLNMIFLCLIFAFLVDFALSETAFSLAERCPDLI